MYSTKVALSRYFISLTLSKQGSLPFTTQSRLKRLCRKKASEKSWETRQNADNQYFVVFLKCVLPLQKQISIFESYLFYHQHMFSIWMSLKFHCLIELKCVASWKMIIYDNSGLTMTNPLPPLAKPSPTLAGRLFSCSRLFF